MTPTRRKTKFPIGRTYLASKLPVESGKVWKIMKSILLLVGIIATPAGATAIRTGYTLNVHVHAAHWFRTRGFDGSVTIDVEILDATIGGKQFQLMASDSHSKIWLMALGDYKGKLFENLQKPTGETHRVYQLLLPGGEKRNFVVVGQSE